MQINKLYLLLILLFFQTFGYAQVLDLKFDYGISEINDEHKKQLKAFSEYIKNNPELNIEIHGHADHIGSRQSNMSTSIERAQTVYQYIVERTQIDKSRISYKGFGDTIPIADKDTEEGLAKNRRAEGIVSVRIKPLLIDRKSTFSFYYSIHSRDGASISNDTNIISVNYHYWLSEKWSHFIFGNYLSSQLNSSLTNSDTVGGTLGTGLMYNQGNGLFYIGSLFYQQVDSDITAQTGAGATPSTIDASHIGFSLSISKSMALAARWLLNTSLSFTGGQNEFDFSNQSSSDFILRYIPKASLSYLVTRKFKAKISLGYQHASREISLTGQKYLYNAGAGLRYQSGSVGYSIDYRQDFGAGHDGALITLGTQRLF